MNSKTQTYIKGILIGLVIFVGPIIAIADWSMAIGLLAAGFALGVGIAHSMWSRHEDNPDNRHQSTNTEKNQTKHQHSET